MFAFMLESSPLQTVCQFELWSWSLINLFQSPCRYIDIRSTKQSSTSSIGARYWVFDGWLCFQCVLCWEQHGAWCWSAAVWDRHCSCRGLDRLLSALHPTKDCMPVSQSVRVPYPLQNVPWLFPIQYASTRMHNIAVCSMKYILQVMYNLK